jgi:hypothetical protein
MVANPKHRQHRLLASVRLLLQGGACALFAFALSNYLSPTFAVGLPLLVFVYLVLGADT